MTLRVYGPWQHTVLDGGDGDFEAAPRAKHTGLSSLPVLIGYWDRSGFAAMRH